MQCVKTEYYYVKHKVMWKKLKDKWFIKNDEPTANSNIIFLDTETTGLPIMEGYDKYYDPHISKYYKSSRVIEIGYIITTQNKETLKQCSYLIKSKGIKNSNIHGITDEMTQKHGIPLEEALTHLLNDINEFQVGTMVCHNLQFDYNVLLAECYNVKNIFLEKRLKGLKHECTMQLAKERFGKKLKLGDLYFQVFKDPPNPSTMHRALKDAIMCKMCYNNF